MDASEVMAVVTIVDSIVKLCVFGRGGHDSRDRVDGERV